MPVLPIAVARVIGVQRVEDDGHPASEQVDGAFIAVMVRVDAAGLDGQEGLLVGREMVAQDGAEPPQSPAL
jgi:hypothetical protein